jgi:hypothetical protein
MVLLFLSELSTFLEIRVGSEMAVDVNRGGEKVKRNFIFIITCIYVINLKFKIQILLFLFLFFIMI